VIVNLVGNAVKFTDRGKVDLDLVLEEQGQDDNHVLLHFRVSDTGVGIPPNHMESVFDAFSQADMSTTRRYGGTGLGLTISSELVGLMNGRIWCEQNEPSGCSFHFVARFELDGDATMDEQAKDSPTSPEAGTVADLHETDRAPRLRILLAEDSRVNQMLAVTILEKEGHTVTIANNGREAVETWQDSPTDFDLILMDVLMPELDGTDATAAIRRMEQGTGRHIPIVAVTAQAMRGDREFCLDAGMDDYISKPIRKGELQQLIDRLFK
jgi:CheY-like chemotaxis protein